MEIKVLGINSSPVQGGNVEHLLRHALQEAGKEEGVTTEIVNLKGANIADCHHCNWCMRKQTKGKPCAVEDDALAILQKMKDCNILILASPVYFARLSGNMACLIDRSRCFIFGKEQRMALRNKVGLALAVGWEQHGGIETTLESLHSVFLIHEMWTPSLHQSGTFFGVGTIAGPISKETKLRTMQDTESLQAVGRLVKKALNTARLLASRS